MNVWTVTDLHEPPLDIQIWLNSMLPGNYTVSKKVTPVNTEEDGKFIIPPHGNFAIVISATDPTAAVKDARVACGWWEE